MAACPCVASLSASIALRHEPEMSDECDELACTHITCIYTHVSTYMIIHSSTADTADAANNDYMRRVTFDAFSALGSSVSICVVELSGDVVAHAVTMSCTHTHTHIRTPSHTHTHKYMIHTTRIIRRSAVSSVQFDYLVEFIIVSHREECDVQSTQL